MSDDSFPYKNIVPPSQATPEQTGAEVVGGRYQLLNLIGQGSMSHVYRARDQVLDRLTAIKLLRDEYVNDSNFVARFNREARAVARLSGPNLVEIYDFGQYKDTYFIAMQYVEGDDLKKILRYSGPRPPVEAVAIINQVLQALAVAHANGIIHRDVKPQNILVQKRDGMVKLTDFGVAHASDSAEITATGSAIGTAYYMAPEQAKGGPVSPATDLYSVGVVLYEVLSGQLPFFGREPLEVMYQHLHNRPPTFASIGAKVPVPLEQVVQRALAKDPLQRYQSANEMRTALTSALAMIEAQARTRAGAAWRVADTNGVGYVPEVRTVQPFVRTEPVVVPENRRNRPLLLPLLLGGLLLLLLGGVIWLLLHLSGPATPAQNGLVPAAQPTTTPTFTAPSLTANAAPALPTAVAAPTATVIATIPLPTVTPIPATTIPATTVPAPTATTVPATATPVPPTATPIPPPTPTNPSPPTAANFNATISPYQLNGAYKRNDGTLYGRPEVSLYGSGSSYNQGSVNFNLNNVPGGNENLHLIGLDDERPAHCNIQVLINGQVVFDGANTFPNVPTSDNGEGGNDRFWGAMDVTVPASVFKAGTNTLIIRNTTPWAGYIGIPYVLINSLSFGNG